MTQGYQPIAGKRPKPSKAPNARDIKHPAPRPGASSREVNITFGIDTLTASGARVSIDADTLTISGIENADEMAAMLARNKGSAPLASVSFTVLGEASG